VRVVADAGPLIAVAKVGGVKGTLGVIVSADLARNVSLPDALRLVETIERRPDIWVSRKLCRQVEALLRSA